MCVFGAYEAAPVDKEGESRPFNKPKSNSLGSNGNESNSNDIQSSNDNF